MPTTDTKREYTADETQAYERYISAVAQHNIVCARPGATTQEKMDAAFEMDGAFREFCRTAGLEIGRSTRSPADIDKIKQLEAVVTRLTESIRSASAMLHGIFCIDVFCIRPSEAVAADHNAACTLLDDAHTVLRAALNSDGRI
jgi:hypothetical protein